MRCRTAYVSRFQRTRIHRSSCVRGDAFALEVNANGALADNAEIDSIVFRIDNPSALILGAVTKGARTASVAVVAGAGCARVKAEITADDGAVFTQLFHVGVQSAPYFQGETAPAAGPASVSA